MEPSEKGVDPMMNIANPIELDALQKSADQACALLRTLANPDRLLLLCQISMGDYCVGDLEALTGIRQPTLSQQLTVLRQEGLVTSRREGKQVFYQVSSTEAMAVIQLLHQLYCADGASRQGGRK